jgi:hypothetical protein
MLHLLRRTFNPTLRLKEVLRKWPRISWLLREARRRRLPQVETLANVWRHR